MQAPTVTVLVGDAEAKLKELPNQCVHMVVTSIPYLGMRDYSICRCTVVARNFAPINAHGSRGGGVVDTKDPRCRTQADPDCKTCHGTGKVPGVEEAQIGSEPTIKQWLDRLRAVFRQLWRVTRDDGTMWVNAGDCWNGENGFERADDRFRRGARRGGSGEKKTLPELHEKDLVGQPWRVAFMIQEEGWILRSDIVWAKPNVMPGSARDRPTRNHEYIFLFAKRGRYYYDPDAVREPLSVKSLTVRTIPIRRAGGATAGENFSMSMRKGGEGRVSSLDGRALRSVWEVAARSYGGGHYATFPEEIPERCIKAGTSERGACGSCGAPWRRVTRKEWANRRPRLQTTQTDWMGLGKANRPGGLNSGQFPTGVRIVTTGWEPTCECHGALVKKMVKTIEMPDWADADASASAGILNAQRKKRNSVPREVERSTLVYTSDLPVEQHPIVPCVVLDPFAGSGTTGAVARRLGRSAILIELNQQYVDEDMVARADILTRPLQLDA